MGNNGMLRLTEESLKEVISFSSNKSVGKIMKRFEIFENNTKLKAEVRELIYENFRDFEDLLIATDGIDAITEFKFIKGKDTSKP